MNFKQLTYQKNFHSSLKDRYLMETISVVVDIEPHDLSLLDVSQKAYATLEQIHKENNPHLYHELHSGQRKPAGVSSPSEPIYKSAIELLKEKQDKEIDGYIAAINLAENEKTLKLYFKRVQENNDPSNQKHTELNNAYQKKSEELHDKK